MGYYTYYDMQVKDISGKGYNAYKIFKIYAGPKYI